VTDEQRRIANETVAKVALSTFIELRRDPVLAMLAVREVVDGVTDALIIAFQKINGST
jgi:hypothetical protein